MQHRWISTLLLLLFPAPLLAGVVYEIEVTDHQQSPPSSESIHTWVEGSDLKMEVAAKSRDGQGEMIFRGESREMVVVDHEKRSYFVMGEEQIRQLAGQVSAAMQQMEEALKNMPEEQRAMMEKMMKERMPQPEAERPQTEIRKTSERADKNGYPCVKYEVLRGGSKIRELWVTDWSNVEGGGEVVDAFEDMSSFFREMLDAMPEMGGRGPAFDDSAFADMKELGGFPVVTRELGADGSLESETVLRGAKRRDLDPEAFEPPSGYKRQEMSGGR